MVRYDALLAKGGADTPPSMGLELVADGNDQPEQHGVVDLVGRHLIVGGACNAHQATPSGDGHAAGSTMGDVGTRFRGRPECRAPVRNSSSNACLPADQSFQRGDACLVFLDGGRSGGIVVKRTGLVAVDPDPNQLPGEAVSLRQAMEGLATQELLCHLPLELDAVGSALGHGPRSFESPVPRSILVRQYVQVQGATPK